MAQFKIHSNIFVLMMILTFSCACMIINCPRGGKRSTMENNEILPIRNCARCGPNNTGHCYGPSICCAEELGCLLGAPETKPCEEEALSPDPCVDPGLGPRCLGGQGFCATNNLCCTQALMMVAMRPRKLSADVNSDEKTTPDFNLTSNFIYATPYPSKNQ